MNNKKGEVPESFGFSDPPIAFQRENAMFFHSPEKYAGLGSLSSRLSFEHSHSRHFACRSDFSATQFPPQYSNRRRDGDRACNSILSEFRSPCDVHTFVRESAMINNKAFSRVSEIKLIKLISIPIFQSVNLKNTYIDRARPSPSARASNLSFLLWKMIRIHGIALTEKIVNKRTSAKAKDIYFLRLLNLDLLIVFRSIAPIRKWRGSLKSFWTIFPSSQLLHRVHCKFYRKLRAARSPYDRLREAANGRTLLSCWLNEPHSTKLIC